MKDIFVASDILLRIDASNNSKVFYCELITISHMVCLCRKGVGLSQGVVPVYYAIYSNLNLSSLHKILKINYI